MSKTIMGHGEIRRLYKSAKNKKEQLIILAELNDCDKEYIQRILNSEIDIPEEVEPSEEEQQDIASVRQMLYERLDHADHMIRQYEVQYRQIVTALGVLK